MSAPRSLTKRSLEEAPSSLAKRSRSDKMSLIVEHHLQALQAELEHERSMRSIDQKRAAQLQTRLEKQVAFAVEEADQAKATLEQVQEESSRLAAQLRQARDEALEELRECQMELEDQVTHPDESLLRMWEKKCHQLEAHVEAQAKTEAALREELTNLQKDMDERWQKRESTTPTKPPAVLEEAPPTILKELNRTRIKLADTERQLRQAQRALEEAETRNRRLIGEREEARTASQRLSSVEQRLGEIQCEHDLAVAENQNWRTFKQSLASQLTRQGITLRHESGGPPEVATILRFLEQAQSKAIELEASTTALRQENERLHAQVIESENAANKSSDQAAQAVNMYKASQSQLDESQRKLATLEAQQAISQREIDSLRALIKTFDDMPLSPMKGPVDFGSPKLDTSSKTLEVSLATMEQRFKLLSGEKERLEKELDAAKKANQEQQEELERLKEKFGKLREALLAERTKVERAEARANEAETLAGKGSFNPETTRVLHLKETPLTEALKEEITVLRRQLEAAKGDRASKHGPDPEKLNKRLKENFKEQISLFREGVYLMTGYKVDMLPGTDRPTFRVRSIFAEREDDHLMLKWPKTEQVSSLDILNTDFAKVLSTTPSYDYMTKFHNLPAFMASVQLSLFEKQTVMM